jgi:hypothetical protein
MPLEACLSREDDNEEEEQEYEGEEEDEGEEKELLLLLFDDMSRVLLADWQTLDRPTSPLQEESRNEHQVKEPSKAPGHSSRHSHDNAPFGSVIPDDSRIAWINMGSPSCSHTTLRASHTSGSPPYVGAVSQNCLYVNTTVP